jgi:hypothetical protein
MAWQAIIELDGSTARWLDGWTTQQLNGLLLSSTAWRLNGWMTAEQLDGCWAWWLDGLMAGQLDDGWTAWRLDGLTAWGLDGWTTAEQLNSSLSSTAWRIDGRMTSLSLLIQIFLLLSLSL